MKDKNTAMDKILGKANKDHSIKTYESADEVKEPVKEKAQGKAGRRKVAPTEKKKNRPVGYSDTEYADIVKCAEFLSMEPQTFMRMSINQRVKKTLEEMSVTE
ncbi:MAG: hypothetical protein COB61_011555 [Thiotrichales bacterium]|nr:hypothetical protein [Thiotrichales bacterium]